MQTLRIIECFAPEWEQTGILLGISMSKLQSFQERAHNNSIRICQHIFDHWIENGGTCSKYPLTWEALCGLLDDLNKNTVAEKLRKVLHH